jgi:glycosyltransferase involved in cell wall biosynthesis
MNESNKFDACFITFNELSTDARTLNFARTLNEAGKKVAVIGIGNKFDAFNFLKEGIAFFFVQESQAKSAWRRWLAFIASARKYSKKGAAATYWSEDVFSLFIAKELKRINGGKIFYDSREIYSQLGSNAKRPIRQKFISFFENRYIRNVDKIIITGELDKLYLENYFGSGFKYYIVKNLPPFKKIERNNSLREIHDIPSNAPILVYQGMVIEGRGIAPAIRALKHLPEAYFVIIGSGNFFEKAKKIAISEDVADRVIFHGKVEYDKLAALTASAEIGLALIEPISISYEFALPNKLFEYAIAGVPVLATDLPQMKEIIEKFGIGLTIKADSAPELIAQQIKYMLEKENHSVFIEACRKSAPKLSWDSQKLAVLSIMED